MTLNNRFHCIEDGGVYYVREIGNNVFWFGESQDSTRGPLRFANIFFGRRSGAEVSGRWFDVPIGAMQGSGDLRLAIGATDSTMRLATQTGGFSGRSWQVPSLPPGSVEVRTVHSGFHKAGYQSARLEDLTGTWMGGDGGTYYVRQLGSEVVWFGERREWSHVFRGTRSGNIITGVWADVPKGRTRGSGSLTIQVTDSFTLDRVTETGGFGGAQWNRVGALDIVVNLERLVLLQTEDTWGDEPFLWTVFIKVDGDTVDASDLPDLSGARATVISTSGSHNNITGEADIGTGRTLAIPRQVGKFTTTFKTIRGLDPSQLLTRRATMLGLLVVAWDEDGFSDGMIEAARHSFVNKLQESLDTAIMSLTVPDRDRLAGELQRAATTAALEFATRDMTTLLGELFRLGWSGAGDDMLGQQLQIFNFADLSTIRSSMPLDLHFQKEGKHHYQITGSIEVA